MKKTLNHRINFSPEDVKAAIIYFLLNRDRPAPGDDAVTSSYQIDENGVELAWCVSYDEKVS